MKANKFLIVNNKFLFNSVEYHEDLIPTELRNDSSKTLQISGGGRFEIRNRDKIVYLYGSSSQYGSASKNNVLTALKNTLLPQHLVGYSFYICTVEFFSEVLAQNISKNKPDFVYG